MRKIAALITPCLFALSMHSTGETFAQVVESQAGYDALFTERAAILEKNQLTKTLLKVADQSGGDRIDLFEAALLIRSETGLEIGNELIRKEAAAPFRGGMFYIHDVMAALLFAGNAVEAETDLAVRVSMREIPIYRGDTENHWLLYYSGLYLAAQHWPDEPAETWFNGRSSDENLADARAFLEDWIRLTTHDGQGEYDSPTYLTVFLAPLLTLSQFVDDEGLRTKIRDVLTWTLSDYAVEYLNGRYVGGHSRDYSYDVVEPDGAPSVSWGWMFFDGPHVTIRSGILLAAWADYRLPFVVNNIANDRSKPYVHRERKRVRHISRYGETRNPPVFKTTYMTADYALGSLQGGILQPIQQHTWDVTFAADMPNATIFTLHPYYSGTELAMFFPEEVEWLTEQVDRYHLVYTDPDKWNSSSPYETTFQYKNTLIVLYDIAADAQHGHVDGFFPKSLTARDVDDSGWIFSKAGNAYVALFPLQPYEWIEEDFAWRLRSAFRRNGFVVEVGREADFASFDQFKSRIIRNKLDVSGFADENRVVYTTSCGDVMSFSYSEGRRLNGRAFELEGMKLFEGPFVNGSAGRLTLSHGQNTLKLDLN